ncbi:hypothetical protein [Rhodohalobacter sp. 614A]|uniref:hypothetical protein n=1 Tax=Rhodohalobacter sp. 614A TaxID=2908649 RepID=UPI001F21B7B1|nr:hypothetical protein [Rhodohalobacter sp. 614A]
METTTAAKPKAFGKAFKLLTKTTPFLGLNILVYGVFFLVSVIWFSVFGGLAYFFAERVELLAYLFFIVAVAGPYSVLYFGRRYILYLVKGAHIAVLTKFYVNNELPDQKTQIAYGREIVETNFKDVSILFGLDQLIHGVVKRFTRRFVRIVDWLPLGGGATDVARWAAKIVERSLSYVDEAILSYAIAKDEENVWNSARHGIILYAQSYKPILMSALKVWFLGKAFYVGLLIILGIPGVIMMMLFDAIWFQIITIVGVFLLTSLIIRAIFEPFAVAYTLITYHESIQGVTVNKEWDERLQSISSEFKKIVDRATGFGKQSTSQTDASVPSGDSEI